MTHRDLTVHIRLALHSLGRHPFEQLPRSWADKMVMLIALRKQQREVGGILKEGV